ncbi:uncharacterized protein LOC142162210 [Nicotiana tabacum]|uniref:Uncharacterized protein LOC142162210 n=1 Tax=Nicotiana tabacum TaxID=4097 RepID=A0AC58RPK1_TOBAC
MKAQALADHLAENLVDDEYQPLSTYFPDEEVNSIEVIPENTNAWKMFFDGAVNAKACIMGMNMAVDLDIEELLIMGDSDLIIKQSQGEWETRDIKLILYSQHVEDLSKRFKSIDFRHIPQFHNELVGALATLSLMLSYPSNIHIDPWEIQIRERHGYCNTIEMEPNVQPCLETVPRAERVDVVHPEFSDAKEYLVREFYANVVHIKKGTKVRNLKVRFDQHTLNTYLGFEDVEPTQYLEKLAMGDAARPWLAEIFTALRPPPPCITAGILI